METNMKQTKQTDTNINRNNQWRNLGKEGSFLGNNSL